MQALYKLALAPIAETTADRNSYGFREGRSCADAVAAAFNGLSKPNSATWILEGDIKGCFDNISHVWLLSHIPLDKEILRKWLRAGYVEDGATYPSRKGTPQGGIISPTLSNMTLDGLEEAVHRAVPRRSRVNFVRYADDFIINRFAVEVKSANGLKKVYQVIRICAIGIKRHVKIKAAANPYLPEYAGYFWRRRHNKDSKLLAALSARQLRAMAT